MLCLAVFQMKMWGEPAHSVKGNTIKNVNVIFCIYFLGNHDAPRYSGLMNVPLLLVYCFDSH